MTNEELLALKALGGNVAKLVDEVLRLRAAIASAMIALTVYKQMFMANGLTNRLEEIFAWLVEKEG